MLNFVDLKKLQNLVISLAKCCFDTANNKPFKVCSERLTLTLTLISFGISLDSFLKSYSQLSCSIAASVK